MFKSGVLLRPTIEDGLFPLGSLEKRRDGGCVGVCVGGEGGHNVHVVNGVCYTHTVTVAL